MSPSQTIREPLISENIRSWAYRIPQLVALLVVTAPQLRSLHLCYLGNARSHPTSVLPEQVGCFRQLTSMSVDLQATRMTTAQVNAVLQTLPLLQHLDIYGAQGIIGGFPKSIASSCCQLRSLKLNFLYEPLGDVPHELGTLTDLTRLSLHCSIDSLPASVSSLVSLKELQIYCEPGPDLPEGAGTILAARPAADYNNNNNMVVT